MFSRKYQVMLGLVLASLCCFDAATTYSGRASVGRRTRQLQAPPVPLFSLPSGKGVRGETDQYTSEGVPDDSLPGGVDDVDGPLGNEFPSSSPSASLAPFTDTGFPKKPLPKSASPAPSKSPVSSNAGDDRAPVMGPVSMPVTLSFPIPAQSPVAISFPSTTHPAQSPVAISFPSTTQSPQSPVASSSLRPDNSSAGGTAVMCPGATAASTEVAWWTYAVTLDETSQTQEIADAAVADLEPQLQDYLVGLLDCNRQGGRRLQAELGIVGMDILPDDLRQEEACTASTKALPCFVYLGSITLFLEEGADSDTAVFETRKAVRTLMSDSEILSIPDVASIEYLSPDLSTPSAVQTTGSGSESNSLKSGGDDSSPTISVLAAVGGLFVVVAMLAAYRLRKDKVDGKSIVGASTMLGDSTQPSGEGSLRSSPSSQRSPYGGMPPGLYQTGESCGMNTILEDNETVSQSRDGSEIIVSECGYTDDESSRDHSYMQSVLHDDSSILGARGAMPLFDDDDDHEILFESEQIPALVHSTKSASSAE